MKIPKVYFYCRNETENLQEDVIALAEGLVELKIPFFANCNYWRQSTAPDDFLFRHDPDVRPEDCDIVIVSYTWPGWIKPRTFEYSPQPLPAGLFNKSRQYLTVYMDSHDGYRTISWEPEYRQFDLILRSKMNRRAWHPDNMRPWAYGFTNRIINATENALPFASRRHEIMVNYGASHPYPHSTRDMAHQRFDRKIEQLIPIDRTKDDLSIEPADAYDALMWRQTGFRYSRAYYERLKHTQAVACFCGDMIPPLPFRYAEQYLVGGNRAKVRRAFFDTLSFFDPRPLRSIQWDSFRFWEAVAAGCATFNVDLQHYGVTLPVMPENWKHYFGIDFSRVSQFIERLRGEAEAIERIAENGHRWALEHYSPRAAALRLLSYVNLSTSHVQTHNRAASAAMQ
jgi:hypothetical protein